jgi:Acetamidase/Formamidase family
MSGYLHLHVDLIKGGVSKYGMVNPIFKPGPVEPRYSVVKRQASKAPLSPRTLQQSARGRPWQLSHVAHATPVKPGLQRI